MKMAVHIARPVIWLTVKVDHHRSVNLYLCKGDVSKFQGEECK
jgi:hypothetical protein